MDFRAADRLALPGDATNGSAVLADATVSIGSTVITLSGQTRIVLQNHTALAPGNFSRQPSRTGFNPASCVMAKRTHVLS